LAALESKLLSYDPTFTYEDTYSAIAVKRSALMSAFRPKYEEGDVQSAHRIHLNVERWRVPEAWFGPPAAGVDAAGLGELIEIVLKTFSQEERTRLVKVPIVLANVHSFVLALCSFIFEGCVPDRWTCPYSWFNRASTEHCAAHPGTRYSNIS
jgi:hypothetical protein